MVALPTLPAGHVITAAELAAILAWIAPPSATKTVDQPLLSNTTLQIDSELAINVAAASSYDVEGVFFVEGGTTGDAKFSFQWPTGATFPWGEIAYVTSVANSSGGSIFEGAFGAPVSGTSTFAAGMTGAGGQILIIIKGTLTTGANAGVLQLLWAQNAVDSVPTIVKAGSTLRAVQTA